MADHFTFEGGGVVKDLVSARGFSPTDKEGRYFFSREAVHDVELTEHELFSCFGVVKG